MRASAPEAGCGPISGEKAMDSGVIAKKTEVVWELVFDVEELDSMIYYLICGLEIVSMVHVRELLGDLACRDPG